MTQRRAKGEGGLRLRPDGRYEARLQITDAFGKRRPLSFYGHTKNEALQKRAAHVARVAHGAPEHIVRQPLKDYLTAWLDPRDGQVRQHVRPHVITEYSRDARLYINPTLGHLPLGKLTMPQVQAMLDKLITDGMAPTSVRRIRATLQSALSDAQRTGLIGQNPCKGTLIRDPRKKEMRYWHPDQVRAFLAAAVGHHLEAYFVLSLTTGARIGEALGLRWQDVDLDKGTLRIERQLLQKAQNGKPAFGEVKRGGKRTIQLSQLAVSALRAHRARQVSAGQLAGTPRWPAADSPVFASSLGDGDPYSHQTVTYHFRELTKKAGLPHINVHGMRHTAASLMILSGEPLVVVSKTLGHSNTAITMNIYGHLFEEQRKHLAEGMDRLLGSKS